VCLAVKPVGKPNAGNRLVRFDERGMGNGALAIGPKLPRPSPTLPLPAILHAQPVEVRAAFWRSSPLAQLINLRQLRNHLTFVVLVPSPKK
jgi:hypothetical protein